jgi:hypothetical protein
MKDKITLLNAVPKNETAAEFEQLKRNMSLVAKLKKAAYDAYAKEGFTPEQALELCKVL